MPAGQWADALLNRMREMGDPLGDAAIAAIYALSKQPHRARRSAVRVQQLFRAGS